MRNILIDNDGVVYLKELKDESNTVVTEAIVTLTALDHNTEEEITGVTWPVEMEHAENGTYKAPLSRNIEVTEGQYVLLKVVASYAGKQLVAYKRYQVVKNRLN